MAGIVDALVFSRDRAAQLDLLLRSIQRHAPDLYASVTVLRLATTDEHRLGYFQCALDHAPGVRFVDQSDSFEADVRLWISGTEVPYVGPTISFLVDDDVFYRYAVGPLDTPCSLRGGDYSYPFSVDGNIYARETILTLLKGLPFRDPTELEWFGHEYRRRLPFTRVNAWVPACLVGVPANRVSPTSGMPHMGVDPDRLLEMYLKGFRLELDLDNYDGPIGAHAEIPYKWVERVRSYVSG